MLWVCVHAKCVNACRHACKHCACERGPSLRGAPTPTRIMKKLPMPAAASVVLLAADDFLSLPAAKSSDRRRVVGGSVQGDVRRQPGRGQAILPQCVRVCVCARQADGSSSSICMDGRTCTCLRVCAILTTVGRESRLEWRQRASHCPARSLDPLLPCCCSCCSCCCCCCCCCCSYRYMHHRRRV